MKNKHTYTNHVTFRLDDEQFQTAMALRNTFPNETWGEAFRFLLGHPQVIEIVNQRAIEKVYG